MKVLVLCNHLFRNDDKESCQHNQIHLIRIKSAQKIFIKCRTALILLRADAYCLNSVLFVDEGTDTGPIILQKAVEVQEGDTPEILQRRVMEQAEWKIMPQAIDLIANGKVTVTGKTVHISK